MYIENMNSISVCKRVNDLRLAHHNFFMFVLLFCEPYNRISGSEQSEYFRLMVICWFFFFHIQKLKIYKKNNKINYTITDERNRRWVHMMDTYTIFFSVLLIVKCLFISMFVWTMKQFRHIISSFIGFRWLLCPFTIIFLFNADDCWHCCCCFFVFR